MNHGISSLLVIVLPTDYCIGHCIPPFWSDQDVVCYDGSLVDFFVFLIMIIKCFYFVSYFMWA